MTSGSRGSSRTGGTNDTGVTERSARRGLVNMKKVKRARTRGIVQTVNWNEIGQPIGRASITLVHYIGSYTRRHVPITCDNWLRKDLLPVKQALWDEIKGMMLYWKEFVENSLSGKFVEQSKKNKERAESMEARYKAACVGYARIREILIAEKIKAGKENPVVTRIDAWEYARRNADGVVDDPVTLQVMEDVVAISNQLEEHELTNIGLDDLLARLIPLEYSGRVRGVGWGVTKTSLQTLSSTSEMTKLKNDISFLKNEIKELKKGYIPGVQSGGSSHMDNFNMDDDFDGDHDDDHEINLSEDLPEGKNPCYLFLEPGRRYVGRGTLWNDPSDRMLHGVPLEEGDVRVQFEVAVPSESKTKLPRACDEANLVGEAPGYFLAWPRKLVSMKLETPPKTNILEKNRNANDGEKDKDKGKERTLESITGASSKQLGYPLDGDVCHDGVVELVRLVVVLNRVTDIEIEMGQFWDGDAWTEHINKENVLEVLNEQWLSASSLAFYIRYLCEVYLSKNTDLAANFSFASPHILSHLTDTSEASANLSKFLLGYVDKEHLLFVPYNVSVHWVLIAINTKTESIYFMDPAPNTTIAKYKNLKSLVETALKSFRTQCGKVYSKNLFNTFKWMNIKCPKQVMNDGIFCGQYVGCFIEDVLRSGETSISINFTRANRLICYNDDKMVRFRNNWAGFLYNRFLKGKLLN